MPTIWEILGLDGPTTDLKAIKKAYARKLREVRPDEDPAGFMALREAFDQAKRMAPFLENTSANENGAETPITIVPVSPNGPPEPGEARPWNYDVESAPLADNANEKPAIETLEIENVNWAPSPPEPVERQEIETIENDHPDNRLIEPVISEDEKLMEIIRALAVQNIKEFPKEWTRVLEKRHELSIDEYQQFEFAFKNYLIALFQDAEIEEQGQIDYQNTKPLDNPPLNGDVIKQIITQMGWETSKGLYSHNGMDEITRLKFKAGTMKRHSHNYNYNARTNPSHTQQEDNGFPFWLIIFLAVIGMNMIRIFTEQNSYKSPVYDQARWSEIQEMINSERNSTFVDFSGPSGRSFEDISADEYFELLKQGTTVAERVNQRRFEDYLMQPDTDVSFLLSAKEDDNLTTEKRVILESALRRMRSRWVLRQRTGVRSNPLEPNKDLSPQMRRLLGLEPSNPTQNLDDTLKMLEGLTIDPSKDPNPD